MYTYANAQVIAADIVDWQRYLHIFDAERILLLLIGIVRLVVKNRRQKPVVEADL